MPLHTEGKNFPSKHILDGYLQKDLEGFKQLHENPTDTDKISPLPPIIPPPEGRATWLAMGAIPPASLL